MITNFLTFLQGGTKCRYMVGLYSDKLSLKNLNRKVKHFNTQKEKSRHFCWHEAILKFSCSLTKKHQILSISHQVWLDCQQLIKSDCYTELQRTSKSLNLWRVMKAAGGTKKLCNYQILIRIHLNSTQESDAFNSSRTLLKKINWQQEKRQLFTNLAIFPFKCKFRTLKVGS